ncbi:MAG TPA: hypothetical protein VG125_16945, partial [Pirellulales bacterium]|nr:hypothetical protein [Pirellulales bacterium]
MLVALLLGLNLPHAAADSYDSSAPVGKAGWSGRTQKPKIAAARPASPGLKWRGESSGLEPARGAFRDAKPMSAGLPAKTERAEAARHQKVLPASSGPALAAPQIRRALHEVEAETRDEEIELTSLTAPSDDPAADPFQDELADEDEMADDGEYYDESDDGPESTAGPDEQDDESVDDLGFDDAELARHDMLDALAPSSEEPGLDIRPQL